MTPELILSGTAIVGVFMTGIGLFATWRSNSGKAQRARDHYHNEQAQRDAIIASNQKAIIQRLDDKETGLQAVNGKLAMFQTHCAKVSTSLFERVANHDRELKELKVKQ